MTKEVDFRLYCPTCKFYALPGEVDPCNTCLAYGHNEDSRRPVLWKDKRTFTNVKETPVLWKDKRTFTNVKETKERK